MRPHILRSTFASTLALFVSACGASQVEGPVSTTTTTMAPVEAPASVAPTESLSQATPLVVQGDNAAAQIASARCTHEDACGRVGTGQAFSSFDACVGELRLEHLQRFAGQVCAHGVDPYWLSQCIEDVRVQSCEETSQLGAPESCGRMKLCR